MRKESSKAALSVFNSILTFIVEIDYQVFRESQQLFLPNRSHKARTIDQSNKVALVAVAVPTAKGEVLVVVGQHSVGQLLDIIPSIRDTESQELTVVTRHSGILNLDLVGGDRSGVHCGNILDYPGQTTSFFFNFVR